MTPLSPLRLRQQALRLLAMAALTVGPGCALPLLAAPEPEPEQAIRATYLCRGRFDAVELRAWFFNREPAEVVLLEGETATRLPQLPAASGSRYGGGGREFWIKGEQARWQLGPAATMACQSKPTHSQR